MLASTIQFSHNTPTTPCQHQQCQQDSWSGTKKGDNAPDTQQCTNIQTTLFLVQLCMDNVCHKAPFKHLVRLLSVCFTRTIFNNKSWQYDTRILNQPQGATAPTIKLLRKEVIHPHLPVRVPCYDFVPIADPTFDGSLTSLGHRLRVLPTFMT